MSRRRLTGEFLVTARLLSPSVLNARLQGGYHRQEQQVQLDIGFEGNDDRNIALWKVELVVPHVVSLDRINPIFPESMA